MPWLEILRWAGAATLGALSLFTIIGNPLAARSAVRQGKGYSMVPFIGGLAGAIAILLAPLGTMRQRLAFAWVPLVLDITFPMLIYLFVFFLPREFLRSRRRHRGTEDKGAAH